VTSAKHDAWHRARTKDPAALHVAGQFRFVKFPLSTQRWKQPRRGVNNSRPKVTSVPSRSGRGRIKRVDLSADGGRNWRTARLQEPVLSKALTRFRFDWNWEGSPALVESRAIDETGQVQPSMEGLRAVRGTRSIYHNNAIKTWRVAADGEITNVQTA
jgi:hypothetical protein